MAKRKYTKGKTSQVEGFAEDLGKLLGHATTKAQNWLGQRQHIVKRLTEVRDTASQLLTDLGHQAQSAAATGKRAYVRRGRPAAEAVVNKIRGMATEATALVKPRRKMSKAARAKISAAQKARWAKQKAGAKK